MGLKVSDIQTGDDIRSRAKVIQKKQGSQFSSKSPNIPEKHWSIGFTSKG